MSPRSASRRVRPLAGVGTVAVLLLLSAGWVAPTRTAGMPAALAFWRVGVPRAIAVRDGRATVRIPSRGPASQTLVIVSALSRGRGPFPIRLDARPASQAEIPQLVDDDPRPRGRSETPPPAFAPIPDRTPAAGLIPPRERWFHLMVREGDPAGSDNYESVRAVLRGVGRRVQVYVDSGDLDRVSRALIADVITTFDDRIHPTAREHLAAARDVDGDGRFTVLISGWLGRLGGGRLAVDGFVKVADFESAVPAPFGNRCDMMYLNAALQPGPYLRAIMAHEYRHAVVYTCKTLGHDDRPEEEGWLDEAIAHLAEDELGFGPSNVDYRISAFLSDPSRYRLVVDDYFAANLFRSHGNRGSTYLFLRWCVDRYGPSLIPSLVRSPLRGIANVEATTGSTFAALFRRWTLAMFRSRRDPAGPSPGGSDDGYRSLDLHAPLVDRELAGPRYRRMSPGDPAECWDAEGTSCHYVIVDGGPTEAIGIRIDGPKDAMLQVTVLPMGEDRARLAAEVRATRGRDGTFNLLAVVRERNGIPVRLSGLTWEPMIPGHRAGPEGRLDMLGVAASFGTSALPARGVLRSRPIAMPGIAAGSGPIVIKVVGTDPGGRRVNAWAEVNIPSGGS